MDMLLVKMSAQSFKIICLRNIHTTKKSDLCLNKKILSASTRIFNFFASMTRFAILELSYFNRTQRNLEIN